MQTTRKMVAFFPDKKATGEERVVVVSREVVSLYGRNQIFTGKYFTLDTIDGPTATWTEKKNVLQLRDGTELYRSDEYLVL